MDERNNFAVWLALVAIVSMVAFAIIGGTRLDNLEHKVSGLSTTTIRVNCDDPAVYCDDEGA